jgi:serine protease Do
MKAFTANRGWFYAVVASLCIVGAALAVAQRGQSVPMDEKAIQHAEAISVSFRNVAKSASPSIVSIVTMTKGHSIEQAQFGFDDNSPFRQFFENDPQLKRFFDRREFSTPRQTPQQRGMGSGFVIDESGIIMTNSHVVKGADEVKVRLSDGREFIASDIKTDARTDVAILRIKAPKGLKAIPLGDSNSMEVGDWVLAIGSPFGLDTTVTSGIISAKGRVPGINQREDYLQTDAAINPGNSGGPLLNLRGEVIGINTAISSRGGGNDGVGFAIPINMAKWVADQLIEKGEVQRGYLGVMIQDLNGPLAQKLNVTADAGALVAQVLADAPAAKAGLKPGDVVMQLDGHQVNSSKSLQDAVEKLEVGKAYDLQILRNGEKQTLSVTIEKMPADEQLAQATQSDSSESSDDNLGLNVQELTSALRSKLNLPNVEGVVVSKVESGSPADNAGLKAGDVIEKVGNTKVATADEFKTAIENSKLEDGILLLVHSNGGSRFVVLQ